MKVLAWDVGLRTLSYCVMSASWCLEAAEVQYTLEKWDAIDVQVDGDSAVAEAEQAGAGTSTSGMTGATRTGKRKKMDAVSIEDGATMLADALHRREHLFRDVDVVIIEQQPAGGHNRHSNVRMKVMSHVIQMYFYTSKLRGGMGHDTCVTFVSPASKLVEMPRESVAAEDGSGEVKRRTISQLYSRNKKFAVTKATELVAQMCAPDHALRNLFEAASVSKKDDLADAFLLNYYYLKKSVVPPRCARQKRQNKQ